MPLEGLADRLGLGMDVQLIVNTADVIADRVDAYVEVVCRGLVAVTLRQHSE